MHLAPIDWIIIAAYLVGCMAAGIYMRRFVHGVEDFAVAGRAMDLNLGIASLAATELGLVTVMYTAQLGFTNGFAGATIGVLMAGAMYLVGRTGFVVGPLRRSGVMTIPELFQKRFGVKVRWLAGLFVVLGGVLNMGIFLRLGGEFLVAATGMPAAWLEWVMTALLGMILVYTVLGGMLSVLITDYLQFIVKGAGIVVTSILVITTVGWNNLLSGLWGAAALVYFSQHGGLPPELQKLSANAASLQATPAYLGLLLPTGFIGLLLAAALAAEMSTDSGYLLTWATVIYNDLILPCVKKPLSQATRLFITRAMVLAIGLFLLFYGLWYEMPGNAWDYLAVTGNIYLASVFTLLVAGLYWRRATATGAYAALILGAIGPLTFLIVNQLVPKENQIAPTVA